MASTYFELSDGSVEVGITITENADGTLQFDLQVLDNTGVIGDMNGLFFDIADESLLDGLTVSGGDITESRFDANSVTKVDGYNNINGDVANEYGKFDVGIQIGTSGMAKDDIQSTSFTLSSDGGALTLDSILSQDFAVRLTSVGTVDGDRGDSTKIGGTAPDQPIDDGPEHIATNDILTVYQDEEFELFGFDILDDGASTVLANDTTDGASYSGVVTAANDSAFTSDLIVYGTNGGVLKISANGQIDFAANGDFDYLVGDQSATTQFTYSIEGGSTANIDVLVFAFSDPDGGGDGPMDDLLPEEGPIDSGPGGDSVIDGPGLPPPPPPPEDTTLIDTTYDLIV